MSDNLAALAFGRSGFSEKTKLRFRHAGLSQNTKYKNTEL